MTRVLTAVGVLSDEAREDLAGLVTASSRLTRPVCRVYGVWMGVDAAQLGMVSEQQHPRVLSWLLEERINADCREHSGSDWSCCKWRCVRCS
jgi:hypothetical protein